MGTGFCPTLSRHAGTYKAQAAPMGHDSGVHRQGRWMQYSQGTTNNTSKTPVMTMHNSCMSTCTVLFIQHEAAMQALTGRYNNKQNSSSNNTCRIQNKFT